VTDDLIRRLRQERKAAIAAFGALYKVRLPLRKRRTREPIRPTTMTLGRLIEIVEAEEKLGETDRAIDQHQADDRLRG
jgi:hypothetical protein